LLYLRELVAHFLFDLTCDRIEARPDHFVLPPDDFFDVSILELVARCIRLQLRLNFVYLAVDIVAHLSHVLLVNASDFIDAALPVIIIVPQIICRLHIEQEYFVLLLFGLSLENVPVLSQVVHFFHPNDALLFFQKVVKSVTDDSDQNVEQNEIGQDGDENVLEVEEFLVVPLAINLVFPGLLWLPLEVVQTGLRHEDLEFKQDAI